MDDPDELSILPEQMVLGKVNQFQNLDEDVQAVSVNNDDRNISAVADAGELTPLCTEHKKA